MPTFVYKGRNRMNEIVTGERVAENRETLERLLRRDQVILTSARLVGLDDLPETLSATTAKG